MIQGVKTITNQTCSSAEVVPPLSDSEHTTSPSCRSCHSVQNRYFGGHQARQSPTVTCTAIPRGQAVNLSSDSDLLPFLALLSLSIRTPRQKYGGGKLALPFSLTSQTNCSVKHVTFRSRLFRIFFSYYCLPQTHPDSQLSPRGLSTQI